MRLITSLLLPLVYLYMATFADLGLTLNTPSNNQQSAQQIGTFSNQAGSNTSPMYGSNNGLTLNSGSQGVLNNFLNAPKQVGVTTNATYSPQQSAPSQSRKDQLTAPGYDRNPAEETELARILAELNAGGAEDQRLIDESYNSSFDYLNKAEGQLRSDYPNILTELEGNYNLNSATLKNQLDSTMGTFSGQETAAQKRKLETEAANRRLYDELRMGYRQRFGGLSSANQGAGEQASMEQMRQMGKTNSSFEDTVREINTQRVNVQKEYDTGVMQLQQQKQSAITQANRDFQQKLLEIEKNRADINMNKAQARLGALQNLRNQIFQINVQNMQFQQTLEAQRQQAELELGRYSQSLGGATNASTGAFNQFAENTTTNPSTNLQAQSTSGPAIMGPMGQIGGQDDWLSQLTGSKTSSGKSSFDFLNN